MREFVKDLNLEKDIVDSIMAEYGKSVNDLKSQIDTYKNNISDYEKKVSEYEDKIKGLNDTIDSNNKSIENLQTVANENKDLKAQLQMSNSNVKKEFSKFVTSEVMSQVNDDIDFAKALENYKKDNPQYFGDTVVKKVQSSPSLNAGGPQPQTTNDIMNNILRGAKNES